MESRKSREAAGAETPGMPVPWERKIVEKLVLSTVTEARRARRWNVFFKLLFFGYLALLLVLGFWDTWTSDGIGKKDHTALVEVDGLIASSDLGVDADTVADSLKKAFKDKHTKGVVVRINSPGGSPVQSAEINGEIRRLREKHPDIPVYAVLSDVAASGGYYVAVAADRIYANRSTIVGSIGVRMDQFGFVEAMEKLGIERRLMTAGEHKGMLDPFLPLPDADREHVQEVLDTIHDQFIAAVREGRGDRLAADPAIFSGLYWTAEEARALGLVDDFGDIRHVAREVVGAEEIVDFTIEEDLWTRLSHRLGTGIGTALGRVFGLEGQAGLR